MAAAERRARNNLRECKLELANLKARLRQTVEKLNRVRYNIDILDFP